MTLRLNLVPGEALLIGKARVENGGKNRCTLHISGDEHVLREKRIMLPSDATTPIRRLYFVVQGIYLAEVKEPLFDEYHMVAQEAVSTWPMLTLAVTDVSALILSGSYYEALAAAHQLVEAETDLIQATKETK